MIKSKLIKPTKQRLPLIHSFILLILGIVLILCVIVCIINSFTDYTIKDIWFYQSSATGSLSFVVGYLLGSTKIID
jgi:hypothetical protein